ncbi:hypothetical protein TNCV_1853261 [Trichonephila clavipes]|nr:hypothetical protein TNCV_1853261 [Trichonephila clavipes]
MVGNKTFSSQSHQPRRRHVRPLPRRVSMAALSRSLAQRRDIPGFFKSCYYTLPSTWEGSTIRNDVVKLPLDRLKLDNCVEIFPTNSIKNGSSYPDRKEFQKIAMATAIGFAIMGFIGFFVKLIHIPINNIIVGS